LTLPGEGTTITLARRRREVSMPKRWIIEGVLFEENSPEKEVARFTVEKKYPDNDEKANRAFNRIKEKAEKEREEGGN
jgi:hypothetical protein